MTGKKNLRDRVRYPVVIVTLLALTFLFGASTMAVSYANGKEVAYSPTMFMVSHTEYRFSEPGQIIARLVDFQGNPVTVNNCTATILNPDKTKFVDAALMTVSTNITGDHYYAFTTPAGPEGVYEYQATCTYAAGAKTASVTNSFHLSSAFTSILGNLSNMQTDLDDLSTEISSVNATLGAQISDLSTQLNNNVTTILANIDAGFVDVQSNFTTVFNNFDTIQSNFSQVLIAINAINFTADFSAIQANFSAMFTQLDNIETTLATEFATLQLNITQILDAIGNVTIDTQVLIDAHERLEANLTLIQNSLTAINITIEDTNTVVNNMQTVLDAVNVTTTNTFDFVTGTLTLQIDDVLTNLGIINATVNRIETNTEAINTTVNDILANQQAEVIMTTFSG